ncbi:MAG: hypothetical protein IKQ92_00335 [Clostridia bacterium]|nr:hypothetical protein [Clostridia bacterium]
MTEKGKNFREALWKGCRTASGNPWKTFLRLIVVEGNTWFSFQKIPNGGKFWMLFWRKRRPRGGRAFENGEGKRPSSSPADRFSFGLKQGFPRRAGKERKFMKQGFPKPTSRWILPELELFGNVRKAPSFLFEALLVLRACPLVSFSCVPEDFFRLSAIGIMISTGFFQPLWKSPGIYRAFFHRLWKRLLMYVKERERFSSD